MNRSAWARALVAVTAATLVAGACSSDKKTDVGTGTSTTAGGSGTTAAGSGTTAAGGGSAFKVDTSDCPKDVNDKITGTVKIGTTMPLSGGAAAAAFAPVAAGMKAYIQTANEQKLVPGVTLELDIEDDQFDSNKTTPAVEKLLDTNKVNLMSGMIGTANNLAVRQSLNDECIPQLFANSGSPEFGNAKKFPWTTGALAPYNTETAIYVEDIKGKFPSGATAAVFNVNSEFGDSYRTTFEKLASDAKINIVDKQTIENADSQPPQSQVSSIASKKPDVILAVPLGAQCPTFLKEIANAKAANAGWNPRIYITATCASTLLLALAGPAADGIFTIVSGIDPADPKNASAKAVVDLKAGLAKVGFTGDVATAAAGWSSGELTVEVLKNAAASPDGLTRASILNAARNFSYHPSLGRDGVTFTMKGTDDPFLVESLQLVQYNATSKTYTDIGSLITKFEGKTEQP